MKEYAIKENEFLTAYNFARKSDVVFSEIVSKKEYSKLKNENNIIRRDNQVHNRYEQYSNKPELDIREQNRMLSENQNSHFNKINEKKNKNQMRINWFKLNIIFGIFILIFLNYNFLFNQKNK